jgi:hypothetical protein
VVLAVTVKQDYDASLGRKTRRQESTRFSCARNFNESEEDGMDVTNLRIIRPFKPTGGEGQDPT